MRVSGGLAFSLPEMHVWLACPDSGEIIDFTTGLWPTACRATLGLDWLAEVPPTYLWCLARHFPSGARYRPERAAIEAAIHFLQQQGRQYP